MMVRHGCGVVISALVLSGCGIFFDDHDSSGSSGTPPTGEPGPVPEPDPRTQEEPFEGECVPQAWFDASRSASQWGAPARFEIDASQVRVEADSGATVHSVLAPLTVTLSDAESIVVFEDATIADGVEGTLVIVGADFAADAGALVPASTDPLVFSDTAATVVPRPSTDDGTRPDLGVDADPLHVAALQAAVPHDVTVEALGVPSYDRAYIVGETGTTEVSGAFVVSASRVYWPTGTTIHAEAVEATFAGEVFIGLEPFAGELSIRGEPAEALPMAILGRDAHLVVGPHRLDTVDPMPVRQALDSYGALIGSEMQLRRCEPETLVMRPGETRVLEFAVRERGGQTDAAFHELVVEAADGTVWTSRIELDGTLPEAITVAADSYPGATWGDALRGFIEAWVDVTRAVTEGLFCVFTFGFLCPDTSSAPEPTPLAPYPAWAEPSSIHAFEIELTAPSTPGTYAITFRATGQNYEATVPATVIVE